jgi:lambda family phage tail tape measure protein
MADTVGAAQLAITADASGVEAGVSKAKKSLATLGDSAKQAGKQASDGLDKMGASGDKSSQKVDRATKQMITSIERATASLEAGSRSSSKFFETLAQQRGISVDALRPYLQQLDAAAAKQTAAAAAAKATAPALSQVGLSAKQTAAALRGVPAQFTDIVTSLQAGQNPLTVFLQQGGQLKDMFGGIGPAARALGGYVLGLVNPFTVAAGAVAALGFAYFQGSQEADNFTKAVILSGNAAGVTVGQLQQMAERIDGITGTQAAASEALAQFVATGTLAGDQIERFTIIALRMEKEGGQAVSETVKQFAELGKSPLEASRKLNEATNFLTASVAIQIRLLEEQGRLTEAATLAQRTYADALESRLTGIEQRLGYVQRAWRGVTGFAKEAWDAMLNVGRPDTLEQQLERVTEQINRARQTGGASSESEFRARAIARANLDDNLKLQASLQSQIDVQRKAAGESAKSAAQSKARLEFDKQGEQFISKRARMEREITEARNLGAKAGASQVEIERRVAEIREKFAEGNRGAGRLARAGVDLDVERIRGEAEKLVGIYNSSERRIETLRQFGLLSDREYYESKRAFINLESQAKEEALQQEIARYQQEKLTGADRLQNEKKIADAQAKLAILRADTSAKQEEISLRQQRETQQEAVEFLAAKQAAEDYFETLARRQNMEIAGLGLGQSGRESARSLADVQERFSAERRRLENRRAQQEVLGTFTDDARRQYDERLSLLQQYEERELNLVRDFTKRKLEVEQDWMLGAQEALKNYADRSGNVFRNTEELFTDSMQSMEDALVKFVQTGKLDFKSLADSIAADITRIIIKQQLAAAIGGSGGGGGSGWLGSLLNFGASMFGGGGGMGPMTQNQLGSSFDAAFSSFRARAIGGPVSAGRMYRVNEDGPELLNVGAKQFLMMGNQSGTVAPTSSGSGGGTTINVSVAMPAGGSRETAMQFGANVARVIGRSARRQS